MAIGSIGDVATYSNGGVNTQTSQGVTLMSGSGAVGTASAPLSTSDSGGTVATNQASVATTATSIAAARTGRRSITIVNGGTTDVFLGASGVTTANGLLLTGTKGASITMNTTAQIFGIVGTGTQTVSFIEVY